MAYRDDISALSPNHHWTFDGVYTDLIGSADGASTGMVATGTPLTEDATNSVYTNGTTDRVSIPTTTTINNANQQRKAIAGWFMTNTIQTPPKRIYGEGNETTNFQFVMAYGNNTLFECIEPTNFTLQVYGPVFKPNRIYHLCGIFEGSSYLDKIRFYVDGVEMLDASPVNRQPGTLDLNLRGVAEFGDPAGTVGIGGGVVLLNSSVNGYYQHWVAWDGASAVLTEAQVRKELFEKGALPTITISTDTEVNMQTALDLLAGTVRADAPLCIRIEPVSGGGDLLLIADNITFDPLASIHIQYTGVDVLTWKNKNGANASIISTISTGSIILVDVVTVEIKVLDIITNAAISGARVYIEADVGGDLVDGTEIANATTDILGIVSFSFDYTADQPIIGRVRKGSTITFYKTESISGIIPITGFNQTILLIAD